jgi:hypothetical protein
MDLAESIMTLGREPKMQLEIFAEIPELILGYVLFPDLVISLLMYPQSCVRNY